MLAFQFILVKPSISRYYSLHKTQRTNDSFSRDNYLIIGQFQSIYPNVRIYPITNLHE